MQQERTNTDTVTANKKGIAVNVINVNIDNPLPITYGGKTFQHNEAGKFMPYPLDDTMPVKQWEARLTSVTHDSCIETITASAVGGGIFIADQDKADKDFVEWLNCINNCQDSANDVLSATLDGERTGGNHFVEIVFSQVGAEKKISVYEHKLIHCRLANPDDSGISRAVIVSKIFANGQNYNRTAKSKKRMVPLFNPKKPMDAENWLQDGLDMRTMIHFKTGTKVFDGYALPRAASSILQQLIEAEVPAFNLGLLRNNMEKGGTIAIKGAMDDDEALEVAQKYIGEHHGRKKQGRWTVVSSENGIDDVQVTPHEIFKEGSYKELSSQTADEIITSHGWAKEFCISSAGGLGKGGDYLLQLWEQKEQSLLNPLRVALMQKVFMPLVTIYAAFMDKPEVLDYQYSLKGILPFTPMQAVDPETYIQVNEARAASALPIDSKMEGVYCSQNKTKPKEAATA
jgi:hypothetical protein